MSLTLEHVWTANIKDVTTVLGAQAAEDDNYNRVKLALLYYQSGILKDPWVTHPNFTFIMSNDDDFKDNLFKLRQICYGSILTLYNTVFMINHVISEVLIAIFKMNHALDASLTSQNKSTTRNGDAFIDHVERVIEQSYDIPRHIHVGYVPLLTQDDLRRMVPQSSKFSAIHTMIPDITPVIVRDMVLAKLNLENFAEAKEIDLALQKRIVQTTIETAWDYVISQQKVIRLLVDRWIIANKDSIVYATNIKPFLPIWINGQWAKYKAMPPSARKFFIQSVYNIIQSSPHNDSWDTAYKSMVVLEERCSIQTQ